MRVKPDRSANINVFLIKFVTVQQVESRQNQVSNRSTGYKTERVWEKEVFKYPRRGMGMRLVRLGGRDVGRRRERRQRIKQQHTTKKAIKIYIDSRQILIKMTL